MITLSHVQHNYSLGPVLEDFSMTVYPGERVGLIGANGSGKSTIFKLIVGIEVAKVGVVAVSRNLRIGYLHQIPDRLPGMTVEERLWQGVPSLLQAEQQMRELELVMANASIDSEQMERTIKEYGEISLEFEHQGGYTYESRMKQVVNGLGLTVPLSAQVADLSGGELARLELAVMLLSQPEILLLDEPTNHLDFSAIRWLEEYIKQYSGTVLVISHDRYFLDQTIQRIVEVKMGEAEEYPGNYSYYLVERERRFELALREYQNQQKEIKKKEEAIKRLRQWAKQADNPKMFKLAAAMQTQLDRIERLDRPDMGELQFQLDFGGERSGKEVVTVKDVSKSFGSVPILQRANMKILFGQRIGLMGPNGAGKTTLLKMILGQVEPDSGEIKMGASVLTGYFDQQQEIADPEMTLLAAFVDTAPMPEVRARGILANYGFTGDEVFKQMKELSGGERSRFILLKMIYTQVNLLILDEPTNHFDLPSVEILEESLQDYKGTLLIISHDRYFLNRVVQEIYAIEDHQLVHYAGNFDYYQRKLQERIAREEVAELALAAKKVEEEKKAAAKQKGSTEEKEQRKKAIQRERELAEAEAEIARLEEQQARNYALMVQPEYLEDFQHLQKLQAETAEIQRELSDWMRRWEELVEEAGNC